MVKKGEAQPAGRKTDAITKDFGTRLKHTPKPLTAWLPSWKHTLTNLLHHPKSLTKARSTTFLHLPLEIRLHIYSYIIPTTHIFGVRDPTRSTWSLKDSPLSTTGEPWTNVLLASKQICDEALDFFYAENAFNIRLSGEGEVSVKKNFDSRNRARMKKLLMIATPEGAAFMNGKGPDVRLWEELLPGMRWVRIVAAQPTEGVDSVEAPSLEEEMEKWIRWLRGYFECFGKLFGRDTVVQVDCNGIKETEDLARECFFNGFKVVQDHSAGDFLFQRGKWAPEGAFGYG
ncbi:hypothetical protein BGZ60DRAFT_47972 [Tricladium varicosporioides]|nr:hypothetical protein BGZ60DRAFT_47972 [Hymenoscyphus varicosporioides]